MTSRHSFDFAYTPQELQALFRYARGQDGTWSLTLQHWDTTIMPPPGQRCTGQLNPQTKQVEVHCR